MVELANYQDVDYSNAFGGQSEVSELIKAMQAGQITGRDTTNLLLGQEPLKLESLDKTLKLLEFRMKDVRLWSAIPKIVANNTVEEFVQLESYGTFTGGFYGEGELADVQDSQYRRRAEHMKYIQIAGEVTAQAQAVHSFVPAMEKEVSNKTMWVIRAVSHYLTKANSAFNIKEFNGIYAQHARIGLAEGDLYTSLDQYQDSKAVIDLRGQPLKQSDLVDAASNVNAQFGDVDTLWAPPTVLDGLAKDYFERQRIMMSAGAYSGTIGTVPQAISTQFGNIALLQDKFMQRNPFRLATGNATSVKAPAAVTATSATSVSDTSFSRFANGEVHTGQLGPVFYAVAAKNEFGESVLKVINTDTTKVTLAAGYSVDLVFTATAGAFPTTSFVIYRSKISTLNNAATSQVKFYPIFEVSAGQLAAGYDGGAAGAVRDRGRILPDTEEAFTCEMNEDIIAFYQLMPIHKLELAVVAPANRFMVSLWGAPRLAAPKKIVKFINVGPFQG